MGRRIGLGLVALWIWGCDGGEDPVEPDTTQESAPESDDGNPDVLVGSAHRQQVQHCRNQYDALEAPAYTEETDQLVCLARANDRAVAAIELKLAELPSEFTGQVSDRLTNHRWAHAGLCSLADAPLPRLQCLTNAELDLAQMVDTFVDFGSEAAPIIEDRQRYSSCYHAYDGALQTAADHQAISTAAYLLRQCIMNANESTRDKVVPAVLAARPDLDSEGVEEAFLAVDDANEQVCRVFADATQTADQFALVTRSVCAAMAGVQHGELVEEFAD